MHRRRAGDRHDRGEPRLKRALGIAVVAVALLFPLSSRAGARELGGGAARRPASHAQRAARTREAATPAPQRTVTLDVKDADVRAILKSVKEQCGIRNLIVDADVQGQGTFYLTDVPCPTAIDVIFRTMGLAAMQEPNSVVSVGRPRVR